MMSSLGNKCGNLVLWRIGISTAAALANLTGTGNSRSPVTIGLRAYATGTGSHVAFGDTSTASGTDAIAIGGAPVTGGATASGNYSTSIGTKYTSARGDYATAFGSGGSNSNTGVAASGAGATAIGGDSYIATAIDGIQLQAQMQPV